MELRVGDYVRTEEFGISRVKWFDNNEPILENGFTALQKEYKSSPNIIDLIEVGDYVNGYDVEYVDYKDKMVICYGATLDEEDIKSIVTKEMYSSVEYRVEIN